MYNIKVMYVLFWFRKSDATIENQRRKENPDYDTMGNICCRVTVDTVPVEIGSVHISVRRSEWDAENQKVRGQDATARRHNRYLSDLRSKIERIYELLQVEHGTDAVTGQMVKEYHCGKRVFRYSFQQLIEEYFRDRAQEVKARLIATETIEVHRNYADNFLGWLQVKSLKGMVPSSFDEDRLDDFKIYLLAKPFAYSHVRKHLNWVKQLFKFSLKKKRIKSHPLEGVRIPSGCEEPDTTHLSIEQLDKLIRFDFDALVHQNYILQETATRLGRERDAFVFSCFTGMHHCDYSGREYWLEDFQGVVFLKGRRKKTKKVFGLKLLEPALSVLAKYGGKIEALPTKSNQKRNSTLKELATICKINVVLSTKIARKTFANMALNVLMMDEGDVAACLGLSTTRSLKHYATIREERIAKRMTSWDDIKRNAA